jgi:hypothetical protein
VKFKQDFVTNSSSTSYVVLIPKYFALEKHLTVMEQMGIASALVDDYYIEEFEEFFNFEEKIPESKRLEFLLTKFKEQLNVILRNKKVVVLWEYTEDDSNDFRADPIYAIIFEFLKQLDLVVEEFPSQGEDGKCIIIPEECFDALTIKDLSKKRKNKK